MGELFVSESEFVTYDTALQLERDLPDDYFIVCDPVIWGEPLDVIVVAGQGLFVLYPQEWEGEIHPRVRGAWREERPDGETVDHENPARTVRRAEEALQSFLEDELGDGAPPVRHYLVLEEEGATVSVYGDTEPPVVRLEELVERLVDGQGTGDGEGLLALEDREALALALRDKRLTVSQRASQPFIFRTSGFFGLGRKARTIRQVVKYMDRYPEKGIEHLQNGTLAAWLEDEGAPHLAALAREVTANTLTNGRVALERFVYGTGLVDRPQVRIRPRRLNLGHVPSGELVSGRLTVRKGRGRGYLHGQLLADAPWLRVEPSRLAGSLEATVTVDTAQLVIMEQPVGSQLTLDANATEEPIEIPVRVHVVPEPARVIQHVLRPLLGLLVGALVGGALGWGFWRWGLGAALWPATLSTFLSAGPGWTAVGGLVGGILGLLRGITQRPEWPTLYGLGRWLWRALIWGLGLAGVAAGLMALTAWLYPGWGLGAVDETSLSILLGAGLLGLVAGTAGEVAAGRRQKIVVGRGWSPRARRWAARGAAVLALVVVLLVGGRYAPPVAARYAVDARAITVREWAGERYAGLEERLDEWVDGIYRRYYEEQAPGKSGGGLLDIFRR